MKYFKTDGIRGTFNEDLTIELIINIGKSLCLLNNKNIVIATDTRISKDIISYLIAVGAMQMGLNVHMAGIMTTPGLMYYSSKKNMIGVMITASHNPYKDNGVKIFKEGRKLLDFEEELLEEFLNNPYSFNNFQPIKYIKCANDEYIKYLSDFLIKTNLKIVLDCANGSAYRIAPIIFKSVTKKLIVLSNKPNGYNINKYCGSTYINYLKRIVKQNNYDLGIAFDGDADRLICVTKNRVLDGDQIIYILALYLKKNNLLNKNTVVLTKMSNIGIIKALNEQGIKVIEVDVGDKFVKRKMDELELSLGGEESGHIIVKNTGDGILNSLIFLRALKEININELEKIKLYKMKMINVSLKNKEIINSMVIKNEIENIKKKFKNDCRVIVRPSGTEQVVRICVMAQNSHLAIFYCKRLASIIKELEK